MDSVIMHLTEQLKQQENLVATLSQQVADLTATITSLQEALLAKNKDLGKKGAQIKGLSKILSNKSEKQTDVVPETTEVQIAPTSKERGNNGAKRKMH